MSTPPETALFDPRRVRAHRRRAARGFVANAFLAQRAAEDLADRLEIVNRNFGATLVIGAPALFKAALAARPALAARVGPVFSMDGAEGLVSPPGVVGDAEHLPFAEQSFGLIVSILNLHWANDLPGALVQARRALRPDGLFLATMFGGRTLAELRHALLAAESETGGAGLRVAPFADAPDFGRLLQRAGFALPVADSDVTTVRYEDPLRLFADLRAAAETSALAGAAPPLSRAALFRAIEIYREQFGGPDGRVRATFEMITATGWAPHESQQKPLKPGSAKTRLADALGAQEISAGEKPER
ncbi:MAG: methyltransferase domain-containing protein [Alphaproteobacteria bacterium]